jgi:nucleoside-diphosphate-sugar epimerase
LAALREIGFQPEVALEDGLQEILSHLQPAGSGVC